jgi:hypothetical protein
VDWVAATCDPEAGEAVEEEPDHIVVVKAPRAS